MTFDEKILSYDMTDHDILLAKVSQVIIEAYSGSYKPNLIQKDKLTPPPYYDVIHSPEGYSLISSDTKDFENASVLTTDGSVSDFIEHVFLILAGDTSVKWNDVYKSDAVNMTIARYFETPDITFSKAELSNIGWDQHFDDLGQPELPIRPTIWMTVVVGKSKDAWKVMESKGFTYLDRNLWYLELDPQPLPKMADAEKIAEYMSHDMSFKSGRGNRPNSCKWYCAYDHVTGEYTAAVAFSSAMQGSLSLYTINKAIWDTVGNIKDDDYKSERLIETGTLALSRDYYNRNGYEMPDKVVDVDYEARFAWYLQRSDKKNG